MLPAALGIRNSGINTVKNNDAIVDGLYGDVARSLLAAIYSLGMENIPVVRHTDCGVQRIDLQSLLAKIKQCGISEEQFAQTNSADVDLQQGLSGFVDVRESVRQSVVLLCGHPALSDVKPAAA